MSRFSRKHDIRKPRKVIRIFTEGEKTEPNYFNSIKDELRLNEIDIKVHGAGFHTIPLVKTVIDRKNEETNSELDTEWWVVFDSDGRPDFNESIELAEKNGIHVAYSNESFELWFVLHYEFLQTSIGKNNLETKLSDLLGVKYSKIIDIYPLIKEKEGVAIRNAKSLETMHNEAKTNSPMKRVPSTLVYILVERLKKLKVDE